MLSMSMAEVSDIELGPTQIFDHGVVLKKEIERFYDNFERNQRYKEFDGLIKRNHRIYEAIDCNLIPALQSAVANEVVEKMNRISDRIQAMTTTPLSKESLRNVNLSQLNASDIAKLAETLLKERNSVPRMEVLVDCDQPMETD